ncbi:MAG: PD-(D/E)XK nuclease family protein [Candidatus Krumholzibacteria bacterium]|nr:PD-(D/E)XK nuclease family protein [Candidatus Krumholzibacteria bacterium]
MSTLVLGIAGSGKTRLCTRRCLSALEEGRRVIMLVPNREEEARLRRALLEEGGSQARFLPEIRTFRDLSREILDRRKPGWASLDRLGRRLLIRSLLEKRKGSLGGLEASAHTPGFPGSLDHLFVELGEAELLPEDLRSLSSDRLDTIAGLYEDFLASQDLRLDRSRSLSLSASFLEQEPELLEPVDLLIVDGFGDLSPLQLRFLDALIARSKETLISLCLSPEDLEGEERDPFRRTRELARHFAERAGWEVEALEDVRRYESATLTGITRGLFRWGSEEPELDSEGLFLIRGATRRDEIEGILREVRTSLHAGVPAGEIAILFRDASFGRQMAEALSREKLPFSYTVSDPLSSWSVLAVLLDLLDWASGSPPRDLPQTLRGGYVATPDSRLLAMVEEGRKRFLRGAEGWKEITREFRSREPKLAWDWLEWQESLPRKTMEVRSFYNDVLLPLLRRVSENLFSMTRENPSSFALLGMDLPALEAVDRIGRRLCDEFGGKKAGLAEWSLLLRQVCEDVELSRELGVEGGGVHLGNPLETRLPELDTVFVGGLNQGSFPPPFRDDPLLRESERQGLNQGMESRSRLSRLATWKSRQAGERYLFYVAATRSRRRLFLCNSQRGRRGKEMAASFFLDEIGRGLKEGLPEALSLPDLSLSAKLARPVSLRDLARNTLFASSRKLEGRTTKQAESFLSKLDGGELIDRARSRRAPEIPLPGHPAAREHLKDRDLFYPTQLETFAKCSYRYLIEKLLRLEKEENFEASAREEGSLFHRIFENFYRDWDKKTFPEDKELESLVATHYDRALKELIGEGVRSLQSGRFRLEDKRRLALIRRFLKRDLDRLQSSGYLPLQLEKSMKISSGDLPGSGTEDPFRCGGIVDRVDSSAEGDLHVIDYKRSATKIEGEGSPRITQFQPALYAMLFGDRVVGSSYLPVRADKNRHRGFFLSELFDLLKDSGSIVGAPGCRKMEKADWDEWLEIQSDAVRHCVASIRAGKFAVNPLEEDTCKNCSLKRLCLVDEMGGEIVGL